MKNKSVMRKFFALLMMLCLLVNLMPQGAKAGANYPNSENDGHEHSWREEWWTHPTCTEPGRVELFCDLCGMYGGKIDVAPLGHLMEWDYYQEPKCLTPGYGYHFCTRTFDDGTWCGYGEEAEVPALGHHIITVPEEWPTCLKPGHGHEYCDRVFEDGTSCDYQADFNTPDLGGHVWGPWITVIAPTTTSTGKEVRYCDRGDAQEEREIPKLNGGGSSSNSSGEDDGKDNPGGPTTGIKTNPLLVLSFAMNEDPAGKKAGDFLSVFYNLDNQGNAPLRAYSYDYSVTDLTSDDIAGFGPGADYIAAGKGNFLEVLYKITQDDINNGHLIRNMAVDYLELYNDEATSTWKDYGVDYYTNMVSIDIPLEHIPEIYDEGNVYLKKEIFNPIPSRGYFVPNETIWFKITIGNMTHADINQILIYDPDLGYDLYPLVADVNLGPVGTIYDNASFYVSYVVQVEDAVKGYKLNRCYAEVPGYGTIYAQAEAPCGMWELPPVEEIGDLVLTKSVINTPSDGIFYEGDTIQYMLVLENFDFKTYYNVEVYDMYSVGPVAVIPVVEPGQSYQMFFDYTLNEWDIPAGFFENYGYFYFEDGTFGDFSNVVSSKVGSKNVTKVPTLLKEVISTPANGVYYTEGEWVEYQFTLTNTTDQVISTYRIYDFLNSPKYSDTAVNLQPGDSATYSFFYQITEINCSWGYVDNTGLLYYTLEGDDTEHTTPSNTCIVLTGYTDQNYLSVYKSVNNAPGNGMFFVEGDKVEFLVTVTNGTNETFTDIWVYDGNIVAPPEYIAKLEPGQTVYYTYPYIVTELDCIAGYTSNIADIEYPAKDGHLIYMSSNEAKAPCGIFGIEFDDFLNALEVVKKETSTPQNGMWYKEGEMISYSITVTNTGDETISDIFVYDSLSTLYGGEIAYIEYLYPGASRTYTFTTIVKAADVAKGYVVNDAWAMGMDPYGVAIQGTSNKVYSPTSEKAPDDGYKFDDERITGSGDLSCRRIMVPSGENDLGYIIENCGVHAKIDEQLIEDLKRAGNESAQLRAYEDAIDAWKEAIDEIYEGLLNRITYGTTRRLLMSDRSMFYTQLTTLENSLKNTLSDLEVAKIICGELKNQCTELCYLDHTAPDSVPEDKERALSYVSDEDLCMILRQGFGEGALDLESLWNGGSFQGHERKAGYEELIYVLCPMHQMGATAILDLFSGVNRIGNGLRDWATIRTFFEMNLRGLMDERFNNAEGEARELVRAENLNFYSYTETHQMLLELVYDTDEDINEAMARVMLDRLMVVCEATDIVKEKLHEEGGHADRRSDNDPDLKPADQGQLEEEKRENESSAREEQKEPVKPVTRGVNAGLIAGIAGGSVAVLGGIAAVIIALVKKKKK